MKCKAVVHTVPEYKGKDITCNRNATFEDYCWQHYRKYGTTPYGEVSSKPVAAEGMGWGALGIAMIIGGVMWYFIIHAIILIVK